MKGCEESGGGSVKRLEGSPSGKAWWPEISLEEKNPAFMRHIKFTTLKPHYLIEWASEGGGGSKGGKKMGE